MSILSRLANYVIYGGSWAIRGYEQKIILAVAKILSTSDQENLLLQLKFLDHIKRLHDDRMVTFYFESSKKGFPRLQRLDPELPLAKLSIHSSKGNLTVHVVAHRGALSSLEFTKSPSHLKEEEFSIKVVEALNVSPSNVPEEIDQEEHGAQQE